MNLIVWFILKKDKLKWTKHRVYTWREQTLTVIPLDHLTWV